MKGCKCDYCGKIIPEGEIAYSLKGQIGIYCSVKCAALANTPPLQYFNLNAEWAQIKSIGLREFEEPTSLDSTTKDVLDSINNLEID